MDPNSLQSQKLEALGRLAGGVAHDFNNLLTVIEGYAQMLLEEPSLDPPARDSVEEILRAAASASRLTRQLLAFSRRQAPQPAVVDLNATLRHMEGMLRRVIGEDVQLEVHPAPEPCPVFADPGHLEQVLMNLVVNARDAMPQGGRVSLRTALDAGHVVFSVADTGHGIPAGIRERLFEPFFTTKEVGRGTGLGLSVVHRIVEDAGGRIDVLSEEGRGAEFRITFPRHGAPEPAAAVEIRRPPSSGTETILVVEDDDRVRNLIKRMLESRGYQVLDAASSEDALALLAKPEVQPAVLVSDVVMPRMDGGELAARAAAQRAGLRVLFVSGYAQDSLPNALPEGAAYLHKPFSADALAGKIRSLIDE